MMINTTVQLAILVNGGQYGYFNSAFQFLWMCNPDWENIPNRSMGSLSFASAALHPIFYSCSFLGQRFLFDLISHSQISI